MTMEAPAALLPAPFTVSMMKSPGQTRNARSRSRCIVGLRPATRASALPDLGADPIDHLLALDPGGRGIGRFFQPGGARRVLVTTGFVVDSGAAETDGPPGAAVLGRALRALGAEVRYVTDAVTAPVLSAALTVLDEAADVIAWPDGDDAARRLLASERPTHLVAIERPGRARDGTYRNMRGADVSEWNAGIDELFVRAGRVTTVGVGDGGNEIGMGNVRARLAKGGGLAARIASVVSVDHLVVAGVSNWGAYGIVAHLGRLAGRPLLHTPDDERRLVAACVAAGACDGVSRRREPTVDGLPLDAHAALVALLSLATNARA